jgi:hypothetical protein
MCYHKGMRSRGKKTLIQVKDQHKKEEEGIEN